MSAHAHRIQTTEKLNVCLHVESLLGCLWVATVKLSGQCQAAAQPDVLVAKCLQFADAVSTLLPTHRVPHTMA